MDSTPRLTLPGPFRAVVLDMDGTLVDTEPLWLVAKEQMFERYRTPFRYADHLAVLGRDDAYTADYLVGRFGLAADATDTVREEYLGIIRGIFDHGVPMRPGAVELLTRLRGTVPVGLATNTRRELVDVVLDVSGLGRHLDAIATSDGRVPKPAPDVYLAACRMLGAEPSQSVAVEDSPTGIAAARAAGLTCVAVPSDAQADVSGADHIAGSLLELLEPAAAGAPA